MDIVKNNTVIEAAISLSSMNLTTTSTIKLGYILNDSRDLRLPGYGQSLASYTCK